MTTDPLTPAGAGRTRAGPRETGKGMNLRRAHIIWIGSEGTGRMARFTVSPLLLISFMLLLFACVLAIPFLERKILSMGGRIARLQQETEGLKGEIATLVYLKEAVAHIEENENILRTHFGLDKTRSLEKTSGLGGVMIPFKAWTGKGAGRQGTVESGAGTGAGELKEGSEASWELEERMKTLITNHESLSRLKIKQDELWEGTPSITPLDMEKPRISSPFGPRKSPFTQKKEFHAGVDFIGAKGTRVIAPAKGKVFNTGHDQWLGNYVVLHHAAGFKTIYGHLSEVLCREGTEVKRGDPIGRVGNTGLSTSPHLHYGVIRGDRAVDPMQYILDRRG